MAQLIYLYNSTREMKRLLCATTFTCRYLQLSPASRGTGTHSASHDYTWTLSVKPQKVKDDIDDLICMVLPDLCTHATPYLWWINAEALDVNRAVEFHMSGLVEALEYGNCYAFETEQHTDWSFSSSRQVRRPLISQIPRNSAYTNETSEVILQSDGRIGVTGFLWQL